MGNESNQSGFRPPIKRYMNAVERRLRLPFKVKVRVMSDLSTTVTARHELGESYEAVMADLGTPAQVAARLNEEMAAFAFRRSPWRFVCLASAAVGGIWAVVSAFLYRTSFALPEDIAVIGGADGPTSIIVSSSPRSFWEVFLPPILLLLAGLVGYFLLRRLRGKAEDDNE